jgi:hypothetical protein
MLDIQYDIKFEEYVELYNSLSLIYDKENDYNLLGCYWSISTQVLNNVCSIPRTFSYLVFIITNLKSLYVLFPCIFNDIFLNQYFITIIISTRETYKFYFKFTCFY